jgi:hypothetical protein
VTAVRVAEHIDPLFIDILLFPRAPDQSADKADVIDILSFGRKGRVLAAVVPILAIAIGIQNYKSC